MNREQQACADYARLTAEIKRLTKAIGVALEQCKGVEGKRDEGFDFQRQVVTYHDGDKDHSHLKEAFIPDVEESDYYSEGHHVYMAESEIREYLGNDVKCVHCLSAFESVLSRKAAKRELGIVKRRIVAYGKTAMKEIV